MSIVDDFLISIGVKKPKIISPIPETSIIDSPLGPSSYQIKKDQMLEQEAKESLKMQGGEPAVMEASEVSTPELEMKNNTPAVKVDPTTAFIQRIRTEKPQVKLSDDAIKMLYSKFGDKLLEPTKTPSPSNLPQDVKSFIDTQITPIAKKYDIPLPVIAGQFIQEGGLSSPGAQKNNFFNLGAYDQNPQDSFVYTTPQEGIEAYAKLISGKYELENIGSGKFDTRYSKAYSERKNPIKMLSKIKEVGYASDPNYVQNIMNNEGWRTYYQ